MITFIGTGHIFDLSEPIMFIIKQIWPDAVLVELDESRYTAMTVADNGEKNRHRSIDVPWIYRSTAKYQDRMSKEYGSSNVGSEMLTAVNTGKLVGARIGFIDSNAGDVMNEIWKEMSRRERLRYSISTFRDRVSGKKEIEKTVDDFSRNEEEMIADMRKKYPTLVAKLIDERNEHMAGKIRKYISECRNIVVVVGDAHVEGLSSYFKEFEVRKIRLADLLDRDRMDAVRSALWNRDEKDEG